MKMFSAKRGLYVKSPIEEIEIEKTTEKFVVFPNGSRRAKRSDFESFFDTYEEAKDWLIGALQKRIEDTKRSLDYQTERLNKTLDRLNGEQK